MLNDLVTWLREQLGEDEDVARMATAGPWSRRLTGQVVSTYEGDQFAIAAGVQGWNGEHIARHDPARVLREVAAKRAIVGMYTLAVAAQQQGSVLALTRAQDQGAVDVLGEAVRLLASAYSDRPGYREEWKP